MPSLFTASGSRIELEVRRSYVFGRDLDCDLVVEDMAASRRHARLSLGVLPELMWIHDLNSRNGTYIDEIRIEAHAALHVGSRIRVGASVFLVASEASMAEDGQRLFDTQTMAPELLGGDDISHLLMGAGLNGDSLGSDIAGDLAAVGCVELVQLLMSGWRTVSLCMAFPVGQARIEIRKGEVVSAVCGDLVGFPALLQAARQETGLFWVEETDTACDRTIDLPASRVLIELCHALEGAPGNAVREIEARESIAILTCPPRTGPDRM